MQPIQELQVWMADNLARRDLSTPALADRVSMSVRNFGRVFTADIGTTPAKYVLHLRVEAARRLLQSSKDFKYIARAVGFGSVDGMRRAFVRVLASHREKCALLSRAFRRGLRRHASTRSTTPGPGPAAGPRGSAPVAPTHGRRDRRSRSTLRG